MYVTLVDVISGDVTGTQRFYTIQPGKSTYTYCVTHPNYVASRVLRVNMYAFPGATVTLTETFPPADLNLEQLR